ncbi:hypothetical protein COT99_01985 [Candidatus Falkowbacteria bacterium CG10_big_fil_rev_8_21_14_0_10_43_10]|uniref:VanZ-like domain-containing protein n=1 Tax=Candidatus Falkowbacteria bacterium CG10_big_fil_rev_8_21_14_0_10_43_10 TaxID=1974567 RepID=A0A2H0V2B6_9BACT|nr:MAG: hypothetical protein COT99_01985 [Candidatus Falkowbacteria bacterium CG10_big_fil_rev_8_21_14_0_10_43_10]
MIKFIKLLLILSWLLLIFLTSHITFPPEDPNRIKLWYEYTYDKSMHLILYGFLAYLIASFLIENKKLKWQWIFWVAVLFCYFYGITDEWHQGFVAGRGVSYYDLCFNVIGGIGGASLYKIWRTDGSNRGWYAREMHGKTV